MRRFKYIVSVLLVLTVFACKNSATSSEGRKKVLEKQEKEKEKAMEDSIEEGKKRHMNIQTKAVKKKNEEAKKKSEALNRKRSGKKKSFFARIFGGKG